MATIRKAPKGSPTFQPRNAAMERLGAPIAYRPLAHWLGTREFTLALYHDGRWHVEDPVSGRGLCTLLIDDKSTARQAIDLAHRALNDIVAKHGESMVLNTIEAARRQAALARADEDYVWHTRLAQVAAEEIRIAQLEAEGMTRSDAQAVLEAEQLA